MSSAMDVDETPPDTEVEVTSEKKAAEVPEDVKMGLATASSDGSSELPTDAIPEPDTGIFGAPALDTLQLSEFLTDLEGAESQVEVMRAELKIRQRELLVKSANESLQLMQEFNSEMAPIISKLTTVQKPLEDLLLNNYVSISVTELDRLKHTGAAYTRGKRWGLASSEWGYKHLRASSKFQLFDIPHKDDATTKPSADDTMADDTMASAATAPPASDGDSVMSESMPTATTTTSATVSSTTSPMVAEVCDTTEAVVSTEAIATMEAEASVTVEIGTADSSALPSGTQIDLVLKQWLDIRGRERAAHELDEKLQRDILIAAQKSEQRSAGSRTLCEMVPWLTMDQCMAVLEMKDDNIEMAMNMCLSGDPTAVMLSISDYIKSKDTASKMKLESTDTAMAGRLIRMMSDGVVKRVTLRVTEVHSDGSILLVGVLDRNRVPLDPSCAPLLKLTLAQLMASIGEMQSVEPEIVARLCTDNVLKVVFQVHDPMGAEMAAAMRQADAMGFGAVAREAAGASQRGRSSQLEFMPISMTPRVRDTEYTFDFDSHSKPLSDANLKRVSHQMDGVVVFNARYDDGTELGIVGSAMDESPVELYTQVLDSMTLNIVMILINDLREDIAVDVKNLTHTDAKLEDFTEDATKFGKDMAGRKLAYKMIVDKSKVVAVLTVIGGEVRRLPYIEHCVPAAGSLVSIVDSSGSAKHGLVRRIPTGLIVTNDPKEEFVKVETEYTRVASAVAARKHVADLHGFVDCDIVFANGEWQLSAAPMREAHNVTSLTAADEMVQTEMLCIQESLRTEVSVDVFAMLESVEANLATLRSKAYASGEEAKRLLAETTKMVKNVKCSASEMRSKHADTSDESIRHVLDKAATSIPKYERELRALRFEVAMV